MLLFSESLVLSLNLVHQIVDQVAQTHVQVLFLHVGIGFLVQVGALGELHDELQLLLEDLVVVVTLRAFLFGNVWVLATLLLLLVLVLRLLVFMLIVESLVVGLSILHLVDHLLLEKHGVHLTQLLHLQTLVHLLGVPLLLLLLLEGSHHGVGSCRGSFLLRHVLLLLLRKLLLLLHHLRRVELSLLLLHVHEL